MAAENSTHAKEMLKKFKLYDALAELPEFNTCLTMLQNWKPYILNAFDCTYSNGFTEGIHNSVLKRVAYGYRNFDNFRRRILYSFNTFVKPVTS